MNKIEKIVYDLVKNNPKLKFALRNIYQSFYDLIPDRSNWFADEIITKEGFFYGFHDLSPFSYDDDRILCNRLLIPLRMPEKNDELCVGFFDSNDFTYHEIGKTKTWNYHKGCRLQWAGIKQKDYVIYNNAHDDKMVSILHCIGDEKEEIVPYPIDTVSPDGQYATTFSYQRLEKFMPGYGYHYSDEAFLDNPFPNETGLFLVDLKMKTRKLIISLKQLANLSCEKSMEGAYHYVTHTQFSPDGDKIAFLHRWAKEDPLNRKTRLITCSIDGSDIHISNTSGMVSHFNWNSRGEIVAYCQIDGIDGHYLFSDYTLKETKRIAPMLNSDGHQSFFPQSNLFITDTYPDNRRYSKIYIVDTSNNTARKIVDVKSFKKFQSPNIYKHWACDLHPRVSSSGRFISFDSVYSGERAFCIMKTNKVLGE